MYKIIKGDVTEVELESLAHALLSDPPYELNFMAKKWDNSGVAFREETWRKLMAQLFPGGFGMAFSSAKLFHRMMVAIEDGGAVMHPMMGWSYSSGFPKATRIDTQVDKMNGKLDERKVISTSRQLIKDSLREMQGRTDRLTPTFNYTSPASPLAQAWEGHRYGQQALAPSLEPIAVFQRPYDGKPILNIIQTGAGALNIDGGRIGLFDVDDNQIRKMLRGKKTEDNGWGMNQNGEDISIVVNPSGRWPKNLLLQHDPACVCLGETEEEYTINTFDEDMHPFGGADGEEYTSSSQKVKALVWSCVDTCAVRHFASQHGRTKSGLMTPDHKVNSDWGYHGGKRAKPTLTPTYADEGEISRFFYQIHWSYEIFEQLQNSDASIYFSKASKREKNTGLDIKSIKNIHPSVKPLDLTRYLATLLLPPVKYAPRHLYIPFSGSGSEMIGALLAGWENITGVELDTDNEYISIANARLEFWQWAIIKYGQLSPKEIIRLTQKAPSKKVAKVIEQQELF